jgi:hypothetical protein
MDSRSFQSEDGVMWHVWPVHPVMLERRSGRERRAQLRFGPIRRQAVEERSVHSDAMQGGWLVFQSRYELRRFPPARDDIDVLSEIDLRELLMKARSYGTPRRAITWDAA